MDFKKVSIFMLTLMVSVVGYAQTKIDGIYYNLNYLDNIGFCPGEAQVTQGEEKYVGDIVIPSTLNYNGMNYKVTSIGYDAFHACAELNSISIPNSVKSIDFCAFMGCWFMNAVTLPNSITSIGQSAFAQCISLTSITIPNSITSIEEATFFACQSLTSITIPTSVKSIGKQAFNACVLLTSVTIPNSVTSLGEMAFAGCSALRFVSIPKSLTDFDKDVFRDCNSLITVVNLSKTPQKIPDGTFAVYGTLHVLPGCKAAYEDADVWKNFTIVEDADFPAEVIAVSDQIAAIGEVEHTDTYKANLEAVRRAYESLTKEQQALVKNISILIDAEQAYKQLETTYILTDGETFNNDSQLTGRDISYTRTFNNTSWQALYIPFSMSYEDWKDGFEIAYINGVRQLDKDDNGTIDETIMDVIKIKSGSTTPNMPYLIKAKKTGKKTLSVSNATLYPAEENSVDCSTTIAKYTFTGTYNAIPSATMIANKYYAMGGGELITSDGSNDLKPYRWYMKVESRNPSYNASNAAKTITINVLDEESETTGVEELRMANDESPVYDLNGRKVNENNLKPGIYVKNGKKFVVK